MAKTKGKCKKRGSKNNPLNYLDQFQEYLLRGTYILGSILVIYTLLMFNILLANDVKTPGNNFLLMTTDGLIVAVEDIWYDTIFFIDKTGSAMGEPLKDTIKLYQQGLAKVFVTTGEILAKVPAILTTPPLQAQVMR